MCTHRDQSRETKGGGRQGGGDGESEGECKRPQLVMQRTCITRLAGSDAFLYVHQGGVIIQGGLLDAAYII